MELGHVSPPPRSARPRRRRSGSTSSSTIVKGIDSASTSLLAALATNDEIKEATLTVRKAGGDALDYYVMTLGQARIVAIDIGVDEQARTTETVALAYTRIEIEYKRQQATGISGASSSFSDEVMSAS